MLFVLAMQFFWLYMDELIGKGFGIWLILQLLLYMSATLVPLALPLAVLLASIMTFGNMGESYELVAIKSSGISLLRIMQPLFIFMLFVSTLAFLFSNYAIPVANLKAYTLLYDLRNSKLTLSLREGQFNNEINGYAIRIGHKSKDGKQLKDVIIYDKSGGPGNDKIILAEEGEMISSADKRYLIFRLKNGWRYEQSIGKKDGSKDFTQVRMQFKESDKVFDMSAFTQVQRTDENSMKGGQIMMNVSQLDANIDTVSSKIPVETRRYNYELRNYITLKSDSVQPFMRKVDSVIVSTSASGESIKIARLSYVPDSLKRRIIDVAESQARSAKMFSDVSSKTLEIFNDSINNYKVEWHRKFAISFACMLLFLIGAPLGAIIRKGGIGMPLIIAVIFFVLYFIVSKTGETLSASKTLPPYIGMWLSTFMLLPFAVFFIRQALTDSKIFTKEWYLRMFQPFRQLIIHFQFGKKKPV